MDSIATWVLMLIFSVWGSAALFIAIVNECEKRHIRSEEEWVKWERSFYETY